MADATPTTEEGTPPEQSGDLGTFDAAVRQRVAAKAKNAGINFDGELAPLADLAAAGVATVDGAYFTQLVHSGYANLVRTKLNLNKIATFSRDIATAVSWPRPAAQAPAGS